MTALLKRFQKSDKPIDPQRNLKNRRLVLEQVKRTWIESILLQSLHGAALIELGMTKDQVALVEHPLKTQLLRVGQERPEPLPPGTQISQVFERAGRAGRALLGVEATAKI